MHIIAIGWLFCAFMLAIGSRSVIAGILVFTFWGVGPVALIWWMSGSRARRARQRQDDDAIAAASTEQADAVDAAKAD